MNFSKENKVQSKEGLLSSKNYYQTIFYMCCVVAVTEFEIWVSWPWKTFFTPVLGFEMATEEKIVHCEESILSCCPAR